MYVKDHMTEKPYTITKDVVISKAVEIMRKNHFHRLPVVDENGKLICPSCGTAQNKTNEMCYFCGTKFKIN